MYRSLNHLGILLLFLLGVIFIMKQRRISAVTHTESSRRTGTREVPNALEQPPATPDPALARRDASRTHVDIDVTKLNETEKKIWAQQEQEEIAREDRSKESIPTLMRRPVKRPRQSVNNITSGLYWALGSWGRVVSTSTGCWPYPTPEYFAIECKRKTLGSAAYMEIEHVASLQIVKAVCKTCTAQDDAPDAPGEPSVVRQVTVGTSSSKAKVKKASTIPQRPVVGKQIEEVPYTLARFRISSAACSKSTLHTFRHTCVMAIDLLFRVVEYPPRTGGAKTSKPPPTAPPEVCFITLGDWGAPLPEQGVVAKVLADVAQRRMVKFIVSTGDNFYPTGVQSVSDQQWLTAFEAPYSADSLQRVRWYICVGNHDQWGLPAQKEYGLEHPRWYLPAYHYSESVPLYHDAKKESTETIEMAVLNTAGQNLEGQTTMLDSFYSSVEQRHGGYLHDMSRHWRFVVNHEPLFSSGYHGQGARGKTLRENFQPYMQQNLIHAYFNGDDHFLEVHRSNGTDYFVSGAGGGSVAYIATKDLRDSSAKFQLSTNGETVHGFMLHCIKEGVMETSLISDKGVVLFVWDTNYFVDVAEFRLES